MYIYIYISIYIYIYPNWSCKHTLPYITYIHWASNDLEMIKYRSRNMQCSFAIPEYIICKHITRASSPPKPKK